MSGSVETAYDCKHSPRGKPLLSAYIWRANKGEAALTATSSPLFTVESRPQSHIWRHMYGFQLSVSVSVPKAFSLFCCPVQRCPVSPFLTLHAFVCLNVCVWPHKLLTLSVFMLASRTSAKQRRGNFIPPPSFFFCPTFFFNKPPCCSPVK